VNKDIPTIKGTNSAQFRTNTRDAGWIFKSVFLFAVSGTLVMMLAAGAIFWHFARGLPKIISAADYRPWGVTRVLGLHGNENAEIGEFFKERRYLIPYEKMPDHLIKAFISAEDDRFFEHPGINILSIIRAGIANFKAGHVVQGGSTITQQVAKSILRVSERSFDRKIKEVILTGRIERNLTKQQILYLYLNQIYLGHGAYGVQAACRTYFRKDVSEITLAEAALLAGMPQAPGKYGPLLNPKKAKERQLYVLRRMYENKYISLPQMTEAARQPLKVFHDEDLNGKYAPYLVEHIRKYLIEKYGEKAVFEDGLTVLVPTNPALAKVAASSLREGLLAVDKRIGYRGPLQHLKNSEEIEKFLEDQRVRMIEKKIQFQLFLPDGRLDPIEAMHFAGIQSDNDLVVTDEIYQAVVTGFDNKKKTARLMMGAVRAELTLDRMKWARTIRDESNPQAPRPEPTLPSRIFQRGDVILVRALKPAQEENVKGSTTPSLGHKEIQVALEQEPIIQGALLSMDVQTGNVLAMVGGYDFNQSEFNRAIQAMRQPGSAFKPVIYAAGLEKGFTPASIIVDSPIVFKDSDGSNSWKPNNYESKFYGDTTFRQALIKSRNIPTVKIVQSVQVPYVIQYAKRLGMVGQFSPDLSIALGSASISLMDLTRVYSLFPRLGRKIAPIFINKIIDRDGNVLEDSMPKPMPSVLPTISPPQVQAEIQPQIGSVPDPSPSNASQDPKKVYFPPYPLPEDPDQVLDPRVAYVMTHLMKEVVTFGTGHEAKNLGRPAAGKTGTTNDSIDAWFMGFTPTVVTGVWVGYDNQKSIGPGETGARAALPIWLNYMKEAVKSYSESDFIAPPGVVFASIDSNTGKVAPANGSTAIKEAFIEGTQPTEASDSASERSESQSDFFKEDRE
jgi:penicillin-binding protein 1A